MIGIIRLFTVAIVFSWTFGACITTGFASDLDGTAWVLSSLPGRSLVVGSSVTVHFEGGRVQGSDGCNRYSAPYMITGSALQVSPAGAATQMACPQPLMEQAEVFMRALTQARAYRILSGQLELLAADGTVLAIHAPQQQTLAGTSWYVTGYNNGREAVVSVIASTKVTMTFSTDGMVSGSAGCNRYSATYTSEGPKLTFGAIAGARLMCAQPEGVMQQEQQFLKALETVVSARVEGDSLELRTAPGQLAATLTRESNQ